MKKLAIIALATMSTLAFAGGKDDDHDHKGDKCTECPEIVIEGTSFQGVAATSSLFLNLAKGRDAYAQQNVSSNSGTVTVEDGAKSVQLTATKGSAIVNLALGEDAYASQNVSSNVGNVTIEGTSWQVTALRKSGLVNVATANTKAVQNIASNNGCVSCQ